MKLIRSFYASVGLLALLCLVGPALGQNLKTYNFTDDEPSGGDVSVAPIPAVPQPGVRNQPASYPQHQQINYSSRRVFARTQGGCDCTPGNCGCDKNNSCGCEGNCDGTCGTDNGCGCDGGTCDGTCGGGHSNCGCDGPCDGGCGSSCGCDGPCDGGCDGYGGCGNLIPQWKQYWCGPKPIRRVFGCGPGGLQIGGWVAAGYQHRRAPFSAARSDGLSFRDIEDGFLINQAVLFAERAPDVGLGFRVEAMYGTDASQTQAFGNPNLGTGTPRGWDNTLNFGIYGVAAPQAYVSLHAGDLVVKAGKFYTPVGYEGVSAPGNFFYSHSLTSFNSEPFTHTGVLATLNVNDGLELMSGGSLGWDTGFDSFQGGKNMILGFTKYWNNGISLSYVATAGDFGLRGSQAYAHSVVLKMPLGQGMEYVLQSDHVDINAANAGGVAAGTFNDQIGVNQYLFVPVSEHAKVGIRGEWWKNDGVSYYAITGGLNVNLTSNLTIRPEVRGDWTPTTTGPSLLPRGSRIMFGIDAVWQF